MIKNCLICKKEFQKKYNYSKNYFATQKYCSRKCFFEAFRKMMKGRNHGYKFQKGHFVSEETRKKIGQANFKTGKVKHKTLNRWYLYKPNHPFAYNNGYIEQSRFIMEQIIGRFLEKKEVIHHINGKTNDDNQENLMLFSSNPEHMKFHRLNSL